VLRILDKGLIHTYIHFFFVNTYILYIETHRPNTNRHVHAHKCLQCAGIEPATSGVVGKYSHHYATSAVIRTGHKPPSGLSAGWWVLTTANAAGTNGLTCLPKHGGFQDNKFLVTHTMTGQRCLASAIARQSTLTAAPSSSSKEQDLSLSSMNVVKGNLRINSTQP
jgi:hypothetical protein